jgi:hypothetical protein
MSRWRAFVIVAVVGALGGCGSGLLPDSGGDRLHQRARDALAHYDQAVQRAGGQATFVPVGDLTGQVGDWEAGTGDRNKPALMAGRLTAVVPLPALPTSTGEVRWDTGASDTVTLIDADRALAELVAAGTMNCPTCVRLQVTGARLTTARVQTTRGLATAPAWEYTLRGTAVRVTRVAVLRSSTVTVTPLPWDADSPGIISVGSATTSLRSRQLTVHFIGAPGPASQPCGSDYTAQAVESDNAVAVIVYERSHGGDEVCNDIGADRTATTDLAQPLDNRTVLEVQQGLPVPVTITP